MADGGINIKMGVSGIAQFKQNMNQAKAAVKTLDEQLKLNEKQFQMTGDKEEYMKQKTELLQKKLEEQKNAVSQAEQALKNLEKNGVTRNNKSFQEMERELAKAQSALIDTQIEMQGVESASDNAAAAVSDMSNNLSNINSQVSLQTVTDGLDKITDGLKNAALKALEFGKAMFMSSLDAAAWADEINTEATMAGVDPELYQRMMKAALQFDTSVDAIVKSKQKLAQAASDGNEDIFAQLGIQSKRYGEVRDLDDLLWETGEALLKINNEAEQDVIGKKLFGSSWRELIPMLSAGKEKYSEFLDSASYVKKEHLDNLNKLNDSFEKLQGNINDLKATFWGELSPHIETITNALGGLVQKFNEFLQTDKGKEMMQSLGDNIDKLFSDITNFDPDSAIEKISNVMDGIKTGFDWISKNADGIKIGLEAIATGWLALKTASTGLKIAELVSGLKGLGFGGGSAAAGAAAQAGASIGSSWATAFAGAVMKAAPWIAGLGYMLTPSDTEDNTIYDAKGNLTPEGKNVLETNGTLNPISNRTARDIEITALAEKAIRDKLNTVYTGDVEEADARNRRLLDRNRSWDDLQTSADKLESTTADLTKSTDSQKTATTDMTTAATNMMNLPQFIQDAVRAGMSGIVFTLDGQAITNYVNMRLGQELNMNRR